jgi:hypothetical protein
MSYFKLDVIEYYCAAATSVISKRAFEEDESWNLTLAHLQLSCLKTEFRGQSVAKFA